MDLKESLFENAFKLLIKLEGYEANDTGGLTFFGISEKSYPEIVKVMKNNTYENNLKIARDIYFNDYWKKVIEICIDCDDSTIIIMFDTSVNCGLSRAREFFYKSFEDCELLENFNIIDCLILDYRMKFYNTLATKKKYRKYLNGWKNRQKILKQYIINTCW